MQTFRTYQITYLNNPVWFPGLDYGMLRAELPKQVDLDLDVKHHAIDEIARGILRQCLQDCHDNDPEVRNEARQWLELHGEAWASGLELNWITGDMIKHYLQHGNGRKRRIISQNRQNSLYLGAFGVPNGHF